MTGLLSTIDDRSRASGLHHSDLAGALLVSKTLRIADGSDEVVCCNWLRQELA
jgi:hypothetical protein